MPSNLNKDAYSDHAYDLENKNTELWHFKTKRKKKYIHKQINVNIVGGVRDYSFEGEVDK
jgi:hypothetical protein